MNLVKATLNSIIKKVMLGLRGSLNRALISPEKSNRSNSAPPDVSFLVQRLNPDLFEVSSKAITGIIGRGTTADQALLDLISQMGDKMSSLIQSTLLMTLHRDEIHQKYKKLVCSFYEKRDSRKFPFLRRIAHKLFGSREKPHLLEVNIALKRKSKEDKLFAKVFEAPSSHRHTQMSTFLGSDKRFMIHPMLPGDDSQILLKTEQGEFPINMLLDQEGNSLDETFSFGFVVNLN